MIFFIFNTFLLISLFGACLNYTKFTKNYNNYFIDILFTFSLINVEMRILVIKVIAFQAPSFQKVGEEAQ